jgi:hypothetical protein
MSSSAFVGAAKSRAATIEAALKDDVVKREPGY